MDSGHLPEEEEPLGTSAVLEDQQTELDLRDLADRLLETRRVEYVDEGVLLIMNPPASEHRKIVRLIVRTIDRAFVRGDTAIEWSFNAENYRWELLDASRRFYVPDIVITHPDFGTPEEERAAIALVVEVTSPGSADTVYNDRVVKPAQYAKGGVPLYLLVDQERASWSLHGLLSRKGGYELLAAGKYGENVPLPSPFGFSIPTEDWPEPE